MESLEFVRLEKNIIDVIKEEQIKLGYREEVIRLYYPLDSLNRILNAGLSIDSMQEELANYFASARSVLGKVGISHEQNRFCVLIPGSGVKYVHEHTEENEFIRSFIQTIGKHGCKIEELLAVFAQYSDDVHFEKILHGEFDYLIYFANGNPDEYRYCITDEGGHLIYHRFTGEDYEDFR